MSGTTCISSGLKTTSSQIYTGRGTLNALTVITDGTNAATVILYDGTSAAGNELAKAVVPGANGGAIQTWNLAIRCLTGIYASISGTGAACIVHYGA